jgi:hypothetical protein
MPLTCNMPLNSCDSGCSASPTPAKPSQSKGSSSGFHPTKKNEPEANSKGATKQPLKTFVEQSNSSTTEVESPAPGTNDGLGGSKRIKGLRTDEQIDDTTDNLLEEKTEARKPAPSQLGEETVIEKIKRVPAPSDIGEGDEDQTPVKPLELDKKLDKNSDGEAKIQLRLPNVNLDDKIAWRATAPRTRIPFHAKTGKVSVARRMPSTINSDWTPVATKQIGPQLVKK